MERHVGAVIAMKGEIKTPMTGAIALLEPTVPVLNGRTPRLVDASKAKNRGARQSNWEI